MGDGTVLALDLDRTEEAHSPRVASFFSRDGKGDNVFIDEKETFRIRLVAIIDDMMLLSSCRNTRSPGITRSRLIDS